MKAHISFLRGFVAICLAALGPIALAAKADTKIAVDLEQPPSDGKNPVSVSLGLYVTNLVEIDEARETFEVGGYVKANWSDPRLAPHTGDEAVRPLKMEGIWAPAIEGANVVSHRTVSRFMEVDRNGIVTYIERFEAVLSSRLDLRKFPFDTQVLQFHYQPFGTSPTMIEFAPQALAGTGISPEEHTELAAWKMKELRYSSDHVSSLGLMPSAHEALFAIVVQRRSGFYIWKIFVPLFILTLIPMAVFWIDVKDVELDAEDTDDDVAVDGGLRVHDRARPSAGRLYYLPRRGLSCELCFLLCQHRRDHAGLRDAEK